MTSYENKWRSPSAVFCGDNRATAAGDTPLPFTFQDDEDTGFFRVAANTGAFAAGGTEVFRFTAILVTFTAYIAKSAAAALTAVGTDRGTSLALTAQNNFIGTAASGTGVTLPAAATVGIGGEVVIFNAGANAIKVYGAGSDTIDAAAAATGVTLTNAKRCIYYVTAAATWLSAQLGVASA